MATIEDVAKHAGVSTATVSRVINHTGNVSSKTTAAVEEAMKLLNYYPNHMARALVKGRSDIIGVILPSFTNSFWSEIARGIETAAKEEGYHVLFAIASNGTEDVKRCVHDMRTSQVCGIIQTTEHTNIDIQACNIPVVSLISKRDDIPSVVSDDAQGGYLIARHLIAKGCKNLVHIGGDLSNKRHADQRTFSFLRECRRQNIACKTYELDFNCTPKEQIKIIINQVFYENPSMDGLFVSNDILAAQCVGFALSQGFQIPDDIRIVGYDDISISSLVYPPLTTVRQDYASLSRAAVRTLIDLMENKETNFLKMIPVELIERKTT